MARKLSSSRSRFPSALALLRRPKRERTPPPQACSRQPSGKQRVVVVEVGAGHRGRYAGPIDFPATRIAVGRQVGALHGAAQECLADNLAERRDLDMSGLQAAAGWLWPL